ncbi:GTPase Era [Alphaproteobacteria bacterium]|nr:GTPase Era [Alphaproteobacteria bacterium]MDC0394768.1 GTPase Era [Alphaproteobacteria bacterium]MDC0462292.1 GTPase Era [Alphaproteobacteria bacterium]MDC3311232.1 GTPase Era [Alphaproteobacteria bacterium]
MTLNMETSTDTNTRAGFAALIGAPNAGKSTLMNYIVGAKVSIVTPKVQTTRSRIRGIAMAGNSQIIFVDTPGIFKPKRRLDRAMVHAAWQGTDEADVTLLLHDCARATIDEDTHSIVKQIIKIKQEFPKRKFALILNKIDLTKPESLLGRAEELSQMLEFEKVFMISAEKGKGIEDLVSWLANQMPQSPFLFDPEDLSDLPQRQLAAEILREKLYLNLHQELPYQLTVETDSWQEKEDGSAEIYASIYVSREGHRGIVLGKKGQSMKRIGQSARMELESMFERRIHLFTHVKFRKDWMNDPDRYRNWDLEFDA